MTEKRAYKRVDVNFPGRFKFSDNSEESFEITTINLSAEGICFRSELKIEKGQEIDLFIQVKEGQEILLRAAAAWALKLDDFDLYRVGVKIVKTDSEDEKKFFEFFYQQMTALSDRKKKILIVDDEKDLVTLLKVHFKKAGYEVIEAFDGEQGYQKYLTEAPDLILLDLKMPKLNGFEVCRKIRRESKDESIPIIMLTALQDDADRLIGKVVGAQKYMTKPFKVEELLREVEWLIPV
ncbi:MAG: response regulator [Candidatus Omnitrophica bacterium]|nr:response regulator [Candidatus Omnitrophota bacterium]